MKRYIKMWIVSVLFVFGLMNGKIISADASDSSGFKIEDGVLVEYYGTDTSVVIPEGVTSIGESAFEDCSDLKSVVIPGSVEKIGRRAFANCYDLSDILITEGVKTIEEDAFLWCCSLKDVFIPASVTNISEAFSVCDSLTEINVSPENTTYCSYEGCLYSKDMTEILICPNGKEKVTIPGTVTNIADNAFCFCSLKSIDIPDSVTNIGEGAFSMCSNLTDISIPNGVENIGSRAFFACISLDRITIPASVTSISNYAFESSGLLNIIIMSSTTEIGSYAFSDCGLDDDLEGDEYVSIYGWEGSTAQTYAIKHDIAFYDLSEASQSKMFCECQFVLEQQSVLYNGCAQTISIVIKDGEKELIEGTDYKTKYKNNKNVGSAQITLTGMGDYIGSVRKYFLIVGDFSACEITLEQTSVTYTGAEQKPSVIVKYKGEKLYDGSEYNIEYKNNIEVGTAQIILTGINYYRGNVTLNFEIVADTSQSEGQNGENSTMSGSQSSSNSSQSGNQSVSNASQSGEENVLNTVPVKGMKLIDSKTKAAYTVTNVASTVSYAGTTNKTAKSINIPPTVTIDNITYKVTAIAANAFKNNKKIQTVTIQGNIGTIGASAFQGCTSLKKVNTGAKVKTIGSKAFYGCKKLSSVTLGKNITSIGKSAFHSCTALSKVTIPAQIKEIGSKAFYNCKKLSKVMIKTKKLSSKAVGSNAFAKVGSSNYKKLMVQVPSDKYKTYITLLKKRGVSSKARIKKQ